MALILFRDMGTVDFFRDPWDNSDGIYPLMANPNQKDTFSNHL